MNLLINQPAGIGDIIFCQKIYYNLLPKVNKIFWPVKKPICWLTNYLGSVCSYEDTIGKEFKLLNLDGCHYNFLNGKIMKSKYDMVGLKFDDYLDYFNPNRNLEKEQILFDLKVKSKYRLICDMYGTPNDVGYTDKKEISESTDIQNVKVCLEPGYTLFDWIKIIENAEEIYCTDSAIMFLVEKFYKKNGDLVAYSRRPDVSEIDYMFTKNWKYVC